MRIPPWDIPQSSPIPVVASFEAVVDDRVRSFDLKIHSQPVARAKARRECLDLLKHAFRVASNGAANSERGSDMIASRIVIRGWVLKDGSVKWMSEVLAGESTDLSLDDAPKPDVSRFLSVLSAGI